MRPDINGSLRNANLAIPMRIGPEFRSYDLTTTELRKWHSRNLPDAPVNDVIIDSFLENTLYVGTDVGVFRTRDPGEHWTAFGSGTPITVDTDPDDHPPTRTRVTATYERSIFKATTYSASRRGSGREQPE